MVLPMFKLKDILKDPSDAFHDPTEVLVQARLTRDEKVQILKQWRYDLFQMQVASDENLPGDNVKVATTIRKIDECLRQLRAEPDAN